MNRLFAFFIASAGCLAFAGCSSAPKVAATAPVAAALIVEDVPAPVVDPSMTLGAFLQAVDQSDALKITLGKMAVAKAMGEPPGATIAASPSALSSGKFQDPREIGINDRPAMG